MATYGFKNAASTTLNAAMTDTTGTVLSATTSSGFPSTTNQQFIIVVEANTANAEVMAVTTNPGGAPSSWTVVRNADGNGAFTHSLNGTVDHVWEAVQAGNMVQLSPSTPQSGSISVTGPLSSGVAYSYGPMVNQADYFYNNVVSGLAVTGGTNQVTVASGWAFINGMKYQNSAASTTVVVAASTNYWIRWNGTSFTAVTIANGTAQIATASQVTLAYATVNSSGVATVIDLRQVGIPNMPATSVYSLSSGSIPPPPTAIPTVAMAAGSGMVDVGGHAWGYTYVTANGESGIGAISATATVASGTQSATISNVTVGPSGTLARRIYRTKAGAGPLWHVGTIPDNTTTTFTDQLPDANLILPAPTFLDSYDTTQMAGHFHAGYGRAIPTVAAVGSITATLITAPAANDVRGVVKLSTTSTTTIAAGTALCTVTFGFAYTTAPIIILTNVTGASYGSTASATASTAAPLAIAVGTSSFQIGLTIATGTTSGTIFQIAYMVIG